MRKLKNKELGRLDVPQFRAKEKTPLVIILDNVRSLHNVGSVFRTADAFLISRIYLCGITGTPPNKDIHKTALGATESVAWEYRRDTAELIRELRSEYYCLAVEQAESSVMLHSLTVSSTEKYALVFGNEVKGVGQEVVNACNGVLEIPQEGTKHSLNIAVSVGVVVWDIWSKMQAAGFR